MASRRDGPGHRAYRRKREHLKHQLIKSGQAACGWCRLPIDMSLQFPDPMSFTADHTNAVSKGGHLVRQDLVPMHMRCNAEKGNRDNSGVVLRTVE